jgi:hypothetical protein
MSNAAKLMEVITGCDPLLCRATEYLVHAEVSDKTLGVKDYHYGLISEFQFTAPHPNIVAQAIVSSVAAQPNNSHILLQALRNFYSAEVDRKNHSLGFDFGCVLGLFEASVWSDKNFSHLPTHFEEHFPLMLPYIVFNSRLETEGRNMHEVIEVPRDALGKLSEAVSTYINVTNNQGKRLAQVFDMINNFVVHFKTQHKKPITQNAGENGTSVGKQKIGTHRTFAEVVSDEIFYKLTSRLSAQGRMSSLNSMMSTLLPPST